MPISGTNITAVIGWYASAINDDTKNDEAGDGDHFDNTERELNWVWKLATKKTSPFLQLDSCKDYQPSP